MAYDIRLAMESDADDISRLVCESFLRLSSSDWSDHATGRLLADSTPEAIANSVRNAFYAAVALSQDAVVGMVLMPRPNIMQMLFVHPDVTRKGIGQALWESARATVQTSEHRAPTIELNSTGYALAFYKAMGFVPISREFVIDGAPMTRMACWLRARELKAELL